LCSFAISPIRQAAQWSRLFRSPSAPRATHFVKGSTSLEPPKLRSCLGCRCRGAGGANIVMSQMGSRGMTTSKGETSQT
jgi:hypothetical protein